MTDRSDSDYDVAHLPDDDDAIYLIGVDPRSSERMMELIQRRFDDLFDSARFIVFAADIVGDDTVKTWGFTSNEIKDALDKFEDADDEADQMVAINRMLPEEDKLNG